MEYIPSSHVRLAVVEAPSLQEKFGYFIPSIMLKHTDQDNLTGHGFVVEVLLQSVQS